MTVTQPYGGNGTVAADGAVSFGVVSTETGSCTFSGTLEVSGGSSTGSGTWVCPNVPYVGSASGTWNAQRVSTLYVTGGPLVGQAVELATAEEVEPLLDVATAHRAAVTASAVEPIEPVQLVVMDLPGGLLGMASSNTIYLDSTAAGYGWFVDRTPEEAEEFQRVPDARRLTAAADGPAAGHVDLLTVLAHELGHLWGLDDLDPQAFPDDLMAATLAPGVRRVPWAAAVDAALFCEG